MIKSVLFAAAAALATVATAAPVLAKDVPVRHSDLNLASVEGQKTLARRIDRAARYACDFASEPRIRSREANLCYKQARAKANTEVATLVADSRLGG